MENLNIKKCKQKSKSFLDMNVDSEVQQPASLKTGVELPKIVLKKFIGDPLEWNQIRENYKAAIHQNTKYLGIECTKIFIFY